jgi:hypothetical protein
VRGDPRLPVGVGGVDAGGGDVGRDVSGQQALGVCRLAGPRAAEHQCCHGRTLSCAAVAYSWDTDGSPTFADQQAAEEWLTEHWRDLDVDEVTLLDDGEVVYGPMSLHPPE